MQTIIALIFLITSVFIASKITKKIYKNSIVLRKRYYGTMFWISMFIFVPLSFPFFKFQEIANSITTQKYIKNVQQQENPNSLTDSWQDMVVSLDNNYYNLPCSIESLLENGWKIKINEDSVLGGYIPHESTCNFEFNKDNKSISVELANYTSDKIYATNGIVVGFGVDDTVDFKISKNISNGVNKDIILKNLGEPSYDWGSGVWKYCSEVQNPNSNSDYELWLTIVNDEVSIINIKNLKELNKIISN